MEQVLHLFITNKCRYNCEFCCNKLYKISEIPVVSVNLLKSVETVCLTGGEPFSVNPNLLSNFIIRLRNQYKNIKNLYIYTSGKECEENFAEVYYSAIYPASPCITGSIQIDGLSFAPKSFDDWVSFLHVVRNHSEFFTDAKSNRLYVFPEQRAFYNSIKDVLPKQEWFALSVIDRIWDTTFNTPENEHFARLPILF